jgi:regulator of protease activity HflC (stomatin/prohibitin superfamily)
MLINGNSAFRFREYESACDRLKAIFAQLETTEGREAVLDKLTIHCARFSGDAASIEVVGQAMAAAMKADAPKYLAGLIERAQADVCAAQNALRDALDDDLLAKHMKKPGAKK